ncbi:MAG: synthase [Patescibacteria group bacterium]|nr:synthase [Patescibacteria group bacterium]
MNENNIKKEIIGFIKKEFRKAKTSKAIIGISGGVDSALVSFLCKEAGLDLYICLFPYKKRGLKEARLIAEELKIEKNKIFYLELDTLIDNQVNSIKKILKKSKYKLNKIGEGNIVPRERMILLNAVASSVNGIIVGTENLSEYLLGYFTEYGDVACDVFPIAGLWKTQVFNLARNIGVPLEIINKEPTGDIFEGLTDEIDLGFSYKEADEILYLYFIKKMKEEEIANNYNFSKKLIRMVIKRVDITNYKRIKKPKMLFS